MKEIYIIRSGPYFSNLVCETLDQARFMLETIKTRCKNTGFIITSEAENEFSYKDNFEYMGITTRLFIDKLKVADSIEDTKAILGYKEDQNGTTQS